MNPMPILRCLALAGLLCSPLAQAEATAEVRFYPERQLWAQQTEALRRIYNVVLPNAAVVNRSEARQTVRAVRFELLRDGEVQQVQYLRAAQLEELAQRGAALAQSGMLKLLDFQFGPDVLLGEGVSVAASTELEPGEALLLPTRFFAYAGPAQQLRTVVEFADGAPEVHAELTLRYDSAPGRFRFPVQGRWYAAATSTAHSHHRWAVNQEFALDLAQIGRGGLSHRGDGQRMRDYYAYGQPVQAVADAEVIAIRDDQPDSVHLLRQPGERVEAQIERVQAQQTQWLQEGALGMLGNYVLLGHADGVYTLYAHLAPGSVKVEVGQRVAAGAEIAAIGSSGSSTEPHLHFHACNGPDPLRCAGIPVQFDNVEIPLADHPRQLQSGDLVDAR